MEINSSTIELLHLLNAIAKEPKRMQKAMEELLEQKETVARDKAKADEVWKSIEADRKDFARQILDSRKLMQDANILMEAAKAKHLAVQNEFKKLKEEQAKLSQHEKSVSEREQSLKEEIRKFHAAKDALFAFKEVV
jgi:chromosome segregation ATPase